jgi:alpha,alpha-trehalase
MLFYLLSADELRALLRRLGYRLTRNTIRKTIEYYLARTSHGSTLSALVHAWVLGRANRDNALEHFTRLLRSDTADIQGGTTGEGVHLAAMAGSVDVLQRCFTGLETAGDTLRFNPAWPAQLGTLAFALRYREQHLMVRINSVSVRVRAEHQEGAVDPRPLLGTNENARPGRLGRVRCATQGRGGLKSRARAVRHSHRPVNSAVRW